MTTPSESFSLRSHLHGLWLPLLTPGGWVRHQDRTIEGALMTSVTDHVEGLARQLSNDLEKVGQETNPLPTLAPN